MRPSEPIHMTSLPKRLEMQFGNAPALQSGSGRRAPDRRQVSLRWLLGSVLVGVTSSLLMGGALYAALDGRQELAIAAASVDSVPQAHKDRLTRGDRVHVAVAVPPAAERVIQVPTMTRVGDAQVIRKKPFAYAAAALAIAAPEDAQYPRFDPLSVFRVARDDALEASSDAIYGADVESEVVVRYEPFPLGGSSEGRAEGASGSGLFDRKVRVGTAEAQRIVAAARENLSEDGIAVSALPYIDDSRFGLSPVTTPDTGPETGPDFSVVASNVTTILPTTRVGGDSSGERRFVETVVPVASGATLVAALEPLSMFGNTGLGSAARVMVGALQGEFGVGPMGPDTVLRVTYEETKDGSRITRQPKRISVYQRGQHVKTTAAVDDGSVVWGMEPVPLEAIAKSHIRNGRRNKPQLASGDGPTLYDGIYRAALSQGLNNDQARRIIRTVAFDVDFRARSIAGDRLEVFYSLAEGETTPSDESEILHIALTAGGVARRYYRFRSVKNGKPHVDFYDASGRSAKKFLLRKPVPNARFGSPFGPRRHPISRRVKMHNGVDFSAPRGTPILAAGNGVVEKAGWAGGYGRQTTIRHANGYVTRYSHQNRIARGIRPGARVRLGQVIGQVGSTGYSTGPHLHYEVLVNGNFVNPMKIRLPQGNTLQGDDLVAFKRERDRIDALMDRGRGKAVDVARL